MAEARAAVNTLRVGTLSLEQVTTAAKLRGVQVFSVQSTRIPNGFDEK